MFFNKGWLLTVCAGAAVLVVAVAAFSFTFKKSGTGDTLSSPEITAGTPASNIPGNAFLPNPERSGFSDRKVPSDNSPSGITPPRTANPPTEYHPPSFEGIKDFISTTLPLPIVSPSAPEPEKVALILPSVSDAEITIDPQGATTAIEYTAYFVSHFRDIQFDNRKLDSAVMKDENSLPFLPIALIEKGIQDNNFSGVRGSLLVYKEFIQARIAFSRSIKVSGGAIDLDKKNIAFDKLTLSLIDTISAPGASPDDDFKNFFAGFKAKALSENKNLLKQLNIFAFLEDSGPFSSLASRFGINIAYAQTGLPFGGQIGTPQFCNCAAGYLIAVGPPVPPATGFLFVPISFLSSPLFFPLKSMKPGAWWLGLYLSTPTPCLVVAGPACVPQGIGSLIFMTGTSI